MNVVACVTDCRLTDVRMDVATADGEGALASSVEQCDCPVQYRGSSCERCAEGFYRSRQHGPYLGTCLLCQCHNRAATCDPHTGHCRVCNRHMHTHYLPAYLLTFNSHTGHCRVCNRHTHTHYLPAYLLTFDSSLSMVVIISAHLPTEHSLFHAHVPLSATEASACVEQFIGYYKTDCGQFRQPLKTHLSRAQKSQCIVTLDYCVLYKYSYLLTYLHHPHLSVTDRQTDIVAARPTLPPSTTCCVSLPGYSYCYPSVLCSKSQFGKSVEVRLGVDSPQHQVHVKMI